MGLELSQTMGGSSGVLLAIFFSAAAVMRPASGQDAVSFESQASGVSGRLVALAGRSHHDRRAFAGARCVPAGLWAAAAARAGADKTAKMLRAKGGACQLRL